MRYALMDHSGPQIFGPARTNIRPNKRCVRTRSKNETQDRMRPKIVRMVRQLRPNIVQNGPLLRFMLSVRDSSEQVLVQALGPSWSVSGRSRSPSMICAPYPTWSVTGPNRSASVMCALSLYQSVASPNRSTSMICALIVRLRRALIP